MHELGEAAKMFVYLEIFESLFKLTMLLVGVGAFLTMYRRGK